MDLRDWLKTIGSWNISSWPSQQIACVLQGENLQFHCHLIHLTLISFFIFFFRLRMKNDDATQKANMATLMNASKLMMTLCLVTFAGIFAIWKGRFIQDELTKYLNFVESSVQIMVFKKRCVSFLICEIKRKNWVFCVYFLLFALNWLDSRPVQSGSVGFDLV